MLLLNQHGVSVIDSLSDADDSVVVITNTATSPEFRHSSKPKLVTPLWIDICIRFKTMYDTKFYSPDPTCLFSGMIVAFDEANVPRCDVEVILGALSRYGGQSRQALTEDVTHLVTTGCDNASYADATRKGIRAILPHYFQECCLLMRKCPEEFYLLPNIPILSDTLVSDLLSTNAEEPNEPSNTFLSQNRFYIDNEYPETTKQSIIDLVVSCGGTIDSEFIPDTTTAVVTELQDHRVGQNAIEHDVLVGTRLWVEYIVTVGRLTHPMQNVLHFPRPSSQIVEMSNIVISISNYRGKVKERLTLMAQHLGASVTRDMSVKNTHLINCIQDGSKFEHAINMNIHMVNHFWLEDIYKSWSFKREAKPAYVRFSPVIAEMAKTMPIIYAEVNTRLKNHAFQQKQMAVVEPRNSISQSPVVDFVVPESVTATPVVFHKLFHPVPAVLSGVEPHPKTLLQQPNEAWKQVTPEVSRIPDTAKPSETPAITLATVSSNFAIGNRTVSCKKRRISSTFSKEGVSSPSKTLLRFSQDRMKLSPKLLDLTNASQCASKRLCLSKPSLPASPTFTLKIASTGFVIDETMV